MKLRSLLFLGFCLLTTSVLGQTITVSSPIQRIVYQRNAADTAAVPISGTLTEDIDRVEARATVMTGYNSGSNTDWAEMNNATGSFSGTLTVPAGGWYKIEIRGKNFDGAVIANAEVLKIGVGEVLITAGQSNSCNSGAALLTPTDDRVTVWNGSGWQFAKDPQPIADGVGGTLWPTLGSLLVQRLNVPVGFICVGMGGASVQQWLPGGTYYSRLTQAFAAVDVNGARAILWHQGEADTMAGTSTANYVQQLNTLINQSRTDAGYAIAWGIAHASWIGSAYAANQPAIRDGQSIVISQGTAIFMGADTDTYIGLDCRLSDTVHMNETGQKRHALLWAEALNSSILKNVTVVGTHNSPLKTSGMLVRIWGRVTKVTSDYIYIDDGSGFDDGSGNGFGIRVKISGLIQPVTKSFVAGDTFVKGITGISSVDTNGVECLRPRSNNDIDL